MAAAAAAAAMAGKPFIPNTPHGGSEMAAAAAAAAMAGKPFTPNTPQGGSGDGECKEHETINGFNCRHCCPDACEEEHPECIGGAAVPHISEVKTPAGGFNCKHCCPDACAELGHPECASQCTLLAADGGLTANDDGNAASFVPVIVGAASLFTVGVAVFALSKRSQASVVGIPSVSVAQL
jgi:hypothetical protein